MSEIGKIEESKVEVSSSKRELILQDKTVLTLCSDYKLVSCSSGTSISFLDVSQCSHLLSIRTMQGPRLLLYPCFFRPSTAILGWSITPSSIMVLTSLTEETFLLHHDAQNDVRSFASHNESPTDLRQRATTALMSLFAVYWVVVFARSIGTTSKVGLVHSLACAEHYGLQPSSSSVLVDCRLADVDARTSSVLAYIVSVSNLASCFFALVLSPPLIKRLGYRGYVTLGTVLLTLHLSLFPSPGCRAHTRNPKAVVPSQLADNT